MSRRRESHKSSALTHAKTVTLVCAHQGTLQRNKAPVKIAYLTIFGRSPEGVHWRVEHLTHNGDPLMRGVVPLPDMQTVLRAAMTGAELPSDDSAPRTTRRFKCSRCPIDVTASDDRMFTAVAKLRDTGLNRIPLEAVAASLSSNS